MVDEALKPLDEILKKPKVRQILEREQAEEASRKIMERLAKSAAKKKGDAAAADAGASAPEGTGRGGD